MRRTCLLLALCVLPCLSLYSDGPHHFLRYRVSIRGGYGPAGQPIQLAVVRTDHRRDPRGIADEGDSRARFWLLNNAADAPGTSRNVGSGGNAVLLRGVAYQDTLTRVNLMVPCIGPSADTLSWRSEVYPDQTEPGLCPIAREGQLPLVASDQGEGLLRFELRPDRTIVTSFRGPGDREITARAPTGSLYMYYMLEYVLRGPNQRALFDRFYEVLLLYPDGSRIETDTFGPGATMSYNNSERTATYQAFVVQGTSAWDATKLAGLRNYRVGVFRKDWDAGNNFICARPECVFIEPRPIEPDGQNFFTRFEADLPAPLTLPGRMSFALASVDRQTRETLNLEGVELRAFAVRKSDGRRIESQAVQGQWENQRSVVSRQPGGTSRPYMVLDDAAGTGYDIGFEATYRGVTYRSQDMRATGPIFRIERPANSDRTGGFEKTEPDPIWTLYTIGQNHPVVEGLDLYPHYVVYFRKPAPITHRLRFTLGGSVAPPLVIQAARSVGNEVITATRVDARNYVLELVDIPGSTYRLSIGIDPRGGPGMDRRRYQVVSVKFGANLFAFDDPRWQEYTLFSVSGRPVFEARVEVTAGLRMTPLRP